MNPLAWFRACLGRPVRSLHTQDAIQESSELLAVKRQLLEFTKDLEAGRIGDDQKVLRLSHNVLEEMVFPDRTKERPR